MEKDKIEVFVLKGTKIKEGDLRASSILGAMSSVSPEALSFLCMCEYFRIGKDVRAAKLKSFDGFNIGKFISNISDKIYDDNHIILIARLNDVIIGELTGWLDDWGATEPRIESLYVENDVRGKGVAKALVKRFIEATDDYLTEDAIFERTGTSIIVEIYNYNKQAKNLFSKFGFKEVSKNNKFTTYKKEMKADV